MKVICERKRKYARQNSLYLGTPLVAVRLRQDWKEPALKAVEETEREVDWSYWPQDVRKFLWSWNALSDSKWRSNLLWFDYLRTYKTDISSPVTTTFSTLKIPIIPLFSSDMTAKSLVDYLRGHFAHPQGHAIAAMVKVFAESFERFYTESANSFVGGEGQLTIDILAHSDFLRIAGEVKSFLTLAMACFQCYYGGMDFSKLIREKAVDLRDLITDQVMHTRVHEVLLHVFVMANREKEAKYMQKVKSLSTVRCEDLGIEPMFCIDQKRESEGFKRAVESLRELSMTTSPMGKVDVIIQTTRKICECVDDYWRNDPSITPSQLVINADQILSIFVYLVLKARVRNLMGHLHLIFEFVRSEVQQGTYGYYVATLEASIEHILVFEPAGKERESSGTGKWNESLFTAEGD